VAVSIDGNTRLAGVIGYPARYSLSPALHNAAYTAMDLNVRYFALPVETPHLAAAIAAIRAYDMLGVSVTVPHKEAVIEHLDSVDESAQLLSSVNCITNTKGHLRGFSTDGDGFIASLVEEGFDAADKHCVVIGSGGAARAVIEALGRANASSVAVFNRNPERGERAAALAGSKGSLATQDDISNADLVVNATPVGMDTADSPTGIPIDASLLRSGQMIADLIYHPPQTPLLQAAQGAGAMTLNGLGMLVYQAAKQISLWTGQDPPIEAMKKAVT
jgi:shikimate dehydrogenase